jgi:hypothetical protein
LDELLDRVFGVVDLELLSTETQSLYDLFGEAGQLEVGVFFHPEALGEALFEMDDHLNILGSNFLHTLSRSKQVHQFKCRGSQRVQQQGHRLTDGLETLLEARFFDFVESQDVPDY